MNNRVTVANFDDGPPLNSRKPAPQEPDEWTKNYEIQLPDKSWTTLNQLLLKAKRDEAQKAYQQIINRSSLRVNNHLMKRIAELDKEIEG